MKASTPRPTSSFRSTGSRDSQITAGNSAGPSQKRRRAEVVKSTALNSSDEKSQSSGSSVTHVSASPNESPIVFQESQNVNEASSSSALSSREKNIAKLQEYGKLAQLNLEKAMNIANHFVQWPDVTFNSLLTDNSPTPPPS